MLPLCVCDETNIHLVFECSYTKEVWREIEVITSLNNVWSVSTIEEGIRNLFGKPVVKSYKYVPLILSQGIWLAKNANLFEDKYILSLQCATQGIII